MPVCGRYNGWDLKWVAMSVMTQSTVTVADVDPQQDDFAPVFLLGPGRSGTTLLTVILSRHSQIASTPETHFFDQVCDYQAQRLAQLPLDEQVRRMLAETRLSDLDLTTEQVLAAVGDDPPSMCRLFRAMLELYAQHRGKPIICEKTPNHVRYVPQILAWYPKARIILLVRDGRDVILSEMPGYNIRSPLWNRSVRWARSIGRVNRALKRFGDRVHILRYEDVLQEPEEQMRRTCEYLGLAYEPTMLSPDSDSHDAIPDAERSWKDKALTPIDPSRAYAWRRHEHAAPVTYITALIGPWLKRLDYDGALPRDADLKARLLRAAGHVWLPILLAPPVDRTITWLNATRHRLKPFYYQTTGGLKRLVRPKR